MNSAFAKTFRSGIQPVEIASALRRELDTKAAVVTRDRILAPHNLVVRLSPDDYTRMVAVGHGLIDELRALLSDHARKQGYSFSGPLTIALEESDAVATGTLDVHSGSPEATVRWEAVVDIAGRRIRLDAARTVIGRGSDADITIADAGSSRRHAEILWDGERAMVRDLGSTNGTKVGGQRTVEAPLPSGTTITIGRTDLVLHIVPEAGAPAQNLTPVDDRTRTLGATTGE